MTLLKSIGRIEKYFFLICVLVNLSPVLSTQFVPTMDGPAHLYNSQLIHSLLFEKSSIISEFYALNHSPVPNWIGHFVLTLLKLIFSGATAEKILVILYLIGLPLSFRKLIKTINPNGVLLSYVIFPFAYTHLFLLGFYNFSIALIFFFLAIAYWLNNFRDINNKKVIILLSILMILTYFSHLVVFGLLFIVLSSHLLSQFISQLYISKSHSFKHSFQAQLKRFAFLLLSSSIPLILAINYFINQKSLGEDSYLNSVELIENFTYLKFLIVYNVEIEIVYTRYIFYGVAFIVTVFMVRILWKVFKQKNDGREISENASNSILFLFSIIVATFLYFYLPNGNGSAGFISPRLALFAVLFLVLFLQSFNIKQWLLIPGVVLILFSSYKLNQYYKTCIKDLNKIAVSCSNAAQKIESNSTVIPFNFHSNWLTPHFSNYLGIDKSVLILENYEAGQSYFPVNWKPEIKSKYSFTQNSTFIIDAIKKGEILDKNYYLFILKDNAESNGYGSFFSENNIQLEEDYTLIYFNDNCNLYKSSMNNY